MPSVMNFTFIDHERISEKAYPIQLEVIVQFIKVFFFLWWPLLVHQVGSKRKASLGHFLLAAVRNAVLCTTTTTVNLIIYTYVTSTELNHCSASLNHQSFE